MLKSINNNRVVLQIKIGRHFLYNHKHNLLGKTKNSKNIFYRQGILHPNINYLTLT